MPPLWQVNVKQHPRAQWDTVETKATQGLSQQDHISKFSVNSAAWRDILLTVKKKLHPQAPVISDGGSSFVILGLFSHLLRDVSFDKVWNSVCFCLKCVCLFSFFLIASFVSQSAQHMRPLSAASCIVIMTSPSCQLQLWFSPEQLLWINCGLLA